jgi:hypothetical protein
MGLEVASKGYVPALKDELAGEGALHGPGDHRPSARPATVEWHKTQSCPPS